MTGFEDQVECPPIMYRYHQTMFRCHDWFRSKNKLLHTRMAYSILMIINFANSVLLTLQVFGTDSAFSFCIFILNTAIVLSALYGLHNLRPVFIAPNVVFKVTLSSGALFYGLQIIENGEPVNIPHLSWLLISVVLFIFEVHAMFSASFGILKELNKRDRSKPPPSYDTVVNREAPPPTYDEALSRLHKPVVLNIDSLEDDVQVSTPKAPVCGASNQTTPSPPYTVVNPRNCISPAGKGAAPLAEIDVV